MSTVKYTTTHEWIEVDETEEATGITEGTIGITERAQLMYGQIVFVDISPLQECEQAEIIGRIETESGGNFYLYAPVAGEIHQINAALEDDIELINRLPEGDGWICKIHIDNLSELNSLLDIDEYAAYEEEEIDEKEYLPETDFYEDVDDY